MVNKFMDSPERGEALDASEDLAAVRVLARTHGVTVKRKWRHLPDTPQNSPITFDVGKSGEEAHDRNAHGTIVFDDWGKLADVTLFGQHQGQISLADLEALLEYGPGVTAERMHLEEDHTLVLEALPMDDILLTGAIPIVSGDTAVIMVVPDALELPLTALEPEPVPSETQPLQTPETTALVDPPIDLAVVSGLPTGAIPSIPVPLNADTVTLPPDHTPMTRAEAAVDVAFGDSAVEPWLRFFSGVTLILVMLFAAFVVGVMFFHPVLLGMSVVGAIIGVVVVVLAIRANDRRLESLRSVGLR
jgi:hypothetical protein